MHDGMTAAFSGMHALVDLFSEGVQQRPFCQMAERGLQDRKQEPTLKGPARRVEACQYAEHPAVPRKAQPTTSFSGV